jgi:hypothetical protein
VAIGIQQIQVRKGGYWCTKTFCEARDPEGNRHSRLRHVLVAKDIGFGVCNHSFLDGDE